MPQGSYDSPLRTTQDERGPADDRRVIDLRDLETHSRTTSPRPLQVVRADGSPVAAGSRGDDPAERRERSTAAALATAPRALLLADLVAVAAVVALVPTTWWAGLALLLPFVATVAAVHGYRARLTLSALDQLPVAVLGALGGGLVHAVVLLAAQQGSLASVVVRTALLAAAALAMRSVTIAIIRFARRRRVVAHRTLVVGSGVVGRQLLRRFRDRPELGLVPVGVLDNDEPVEGGGTTDLDAPWLGGLDRLATTVLDHDVDVVVVAFSRQPESEMVDVLRTCDRLDCEFFFVPRLFEVQSVHADMDEAWGVPLMRVRRAAFRTVAWRVKRMLDVGVASLALAVLSPVLLAVALAVRLDGGPGVLFRQERVGLDGRAFTMLKFRSLRPADDEESATRWNVAHDDRMGTVGRIIRATSLDELPQLVNVVRGDMSLVGPRPERPHFVREFSASVPRYTGRHRVPAGLTGLAAVHGLRGDTSIADRARIDNYYIENWSLWLDAKVVLRTLAAVVRQTGS